MKKISGYVLVKETNAGVSNLLVTAYDFGKSSDNYTVRKSVSAESLREGRRIGSVLTRHDGFFVLPTEDLEYQGNESRPDLVLTVSAPEDVLEVEDALPAPPERRLLYMSAVPRGAAGAEEAFVIRLLQTQLEKFDIAAVDASEGNSLASSVESSWKFQDTSRAALKPRVNEEHAKLKKFRNLAHRHVQHLTAIPRYLRDNSNGPNQLRSNRFLLTDRKELENLGTLQSTVITEGLERLSTQRPRVNLRLTTQDLTDLGLQLHDDKLTGKLDSAKLVEKIHSLIQVVDLVRVRGPNGISADELERKYLLDH